MKIVSWNMNKTTTERVKSWEYLSALNPDIALIQEVNSIPDFIKTKFQSHFQKATNQDRSLQKFSTAILVKGEIVNQIQLTSQSDWVNEKLNSFAGIFLAVEAVLENGFRANIVSVHSPAWFFDSEGLDEIELNRIKLKNNRKIWGTELLWAALSNLFSQSDLPWIVGGDFNTSTLFDFPRNRGNQEVLDRMKSIGLEECLFYSQGVPTPTFRNVRSKELVHQLDYLFVSSPLVAKLKKCVVEKADIIFSDRLSDHLPVIADFDLN